MRESMRDVIKKNYKCKLLFLECSKIGLGEGFYMLEAAFVNRKRASHLKIITVSGIQTVDGISFFKTVFLIIFKYEFVDLYFIKSHCTVKFPF